MLAARPAGRCGSCWYCWESYEQEFKRHKGVKEGCLFPELSCFVPLYLSNFGPYLTNLFYRQILIGIDTQIARNHQAFPDHFFSGKLGSVLF